MVTTPVLTKRQLRVRENRSDLMVLVRKSVLAAFAVAAVVGLSGCGTTETVRGHVLDLEDVAKIRQGESTKQQVATLLGSPTSVVKFSQHGDTWLYVSSRTEQVTELDVSLKDRAVVAIAFDLDDRVARVHRYDRKKERDIKPVSRTTETQGQSLTAIQQILGNIGIQ